MHLKPIVQSLCDVRSRSYMGFVKALCASGRKMPRKAVVVLLPPPASHEGLNSGRWALLQNGITIDSIRIWGLQVKLVKDKMNETDVDFFLDVHGDEEVR